MALELLQLLCGSRFVVASRFAQVFVGFGTPLSQTRLETIGPVADEGAVRPISDGELRARVAIHLAGALAERLLIGETSTGSADDARQAGQLMLERPLPNFGYVRFGDCRATAEGILEAHRCGLERLARRALTEGDLAGAALRDALADALVADALPAMP